jgi:predicted Zn-dependent peptidase
MAAPASRPYKEHFDKVLAIYNDILRNPAFPSEKIELAKIEYKSAILAGVTTMSRDRPARVHSAHLWR